MNFNKYTNTAIKAAKIGGKILLRHFNSKLSVDYKGRIDPVTVADRSSQAAVKKYITKIFPEHKVIGEEDKKKTGCSGYCWIIDPLDGTVNFIHGVPFFCVSIALTKDAKTISGAVFAPCLNEMFVAQEGSGAFLNGKIIHVSRHKDMLRSLVVTGFSYDIHSKSKGTMRSLSNVIVKAQGVRRLGPAALDQAYVADGRFEAFWEKGLKSWDVAAGSLIVTEAGGKVTEFDGNSGYLFGETLLATNGLIHKQMLSLIRS